ncbi:Pol, partial [Symbiodinium sp. CCMP2456]
TAGDEPTSGPAGCKGPISSAVAVAVGVATLLILVASVAFGALHRGDETGQVLDFRDVRRSNLGGRGPDLGAPELVYGSVLWGAEGHVDLVVQASHGYQAQTARDNGLEGHLGRISLRPSREAHFNFSFRAAGGGARTQVQRFFFTVFLTSSGERVRVSNFTRLCWAVAEARHGYGQAPVSTGGGRRAVGVLQQASEAARGRAFIADFCGFGTAWRKATESLAGKVPQTRRACPCRAFSTQTLRAACRHDCARCWVVSPRCSQC